MKKILTFAMTIILAFCACSISACGDEKEVDETTQIKYVPCSEEYSTIPMANPIQAVNSFYLDDTYYYLFDLGTIQQVPLQNSYAVVEFNGLKYSHSLVCSQTSSTTISEQVSLATSLCTSWTKSLSADIGIEITVMPNILKSKIDVGFSSAYSESKGYTATESYGRAENYSETYSQTWEINFDDSYPYGYYRTILMGDVEVYAVVIYDTEQDTYYIDNYSVVKENSYFFRLEYCENNYFNNYTNQELPFSIDWETVKKLPKPTTDLANMLGDDWDNINYGGGYGTEDSPFLLYTIDHLKNIALNPNAYYKLKNDIDMTDINWKPIESFSGEFDGNHHKIMGFKISTGGVNISGTGTDVYESGFFIYNTGTIKNLQIGENGYDTTLIVSMNWQNRHINAGILVGYNAGIIENCRIINCSGQTDIAMQDESVKNNVFYNNLGSVCGVSRQGSIKYCYVQGCKLTANATGRYNNISVIARVGGVVGYAENSAISNCLVENNTLISYAKTNEGAILNKSGNPYSKAGGVVGELIKSDIDHCVVFENTIEAKKSVGNYSQGEGNSYEGSIIGHSNSTKSNALVGIAESKQCSGSNSNYENYLVITENSLVALLNAFSNFNLDFWVADENGRIQLLFI